MSFNHAQPGDIFECRQCGDCCRGYGGTFVTPEDIAAIAAYIHTDPKQFVEKWCAFSGSRPVLAQKEDGYCVFWDRVCTIHPVKPRMCRAWPYIESVMIDPGNWEIMSSMCPGIKTGVAPETIQACVRRHLADLPPAGSRHSEQPVSEGRSANDRHL